MITIFKRILNKYANRLISRISKSQKFIQQEQFSYDVISSLFSESYFIPFTTWTISPSTIHHVLNDIVINKRKCIVEFGTGASTFFIAKLIKVYGYDTSFFSIESDEVWAKQAKKEIKALKLEKYVKIIYAPMANVSNNISYKGQEFWHDINILELEFKFIKPVDLVLIDGPNAKFTPYARFSAVPFLKSKLSKHYSIFLDDIDRLEEREISMVWEKHLGCKIRLYNRYAVLYNGSKFISGPFRV